MSAMSQLTLRLLLLCFFAGWGTPLSAASQPVPATVRPWVVAVVPQFTPLQVHTDWTLLLERLARDSGVPLVLKTYTRIPEFEADLLKGIPDFAYMNPYHVVMARRATAYLPLVRNNKPLVGMLVVRRDSSVQSVRQLAGQKLAFPAPNAFGASLYMRALLKEQEGVVIEPVYVKTHSNVLRWVIQGETLAGGVINTALQREPEAVIQALRILYETPSIPPHPLAAHPRVPRAQRQAVADALLALSRDAQALPLLAAIQLAEPVVADYARDYQPLERLRLEKYLVIEGN